MDSYDIANLLSGPQVKTRLDEANTMLEGFCLTPHKNETPANWDPWVNMPYTEFALKTLWQTELVRKHFMAATNAAHFWVAREQGRLKILASRLQPSQQAELFENYIDRLATRQVLRHVAFPTLVCLVMKLQYHARHCVQM